MTKRVARPVAPRSLGEGGQISAEPIVRGSGMSARWPVLPSVTSPMLPFFSPTPAEEDDVVVADVVPDPPNVGPVSILTIESFRGMTAQTCRDVIAALEREVGADHAERLCTMQEEFRAALSLREHYEGYSFHPSLTAIAHELAALMCAFGSLPIPKERFPQVRVQSTEEFLRIFGTPCDMYYTCHPSNTITVHANSMRSDGDFPQTFYEELGEELGHFLRTEIGKEVGLPKQLPEGIHGWVRSWLVEEFYGYMGRRILQEAIRGDPLESTLFPSGQCEPFIALPELRRIRAELRSWFSRTRWSLAVRRERRARRKDLLTHARGYQFAQQVDMDCITDWHAFFALPEQDVRRRFFREDPDYSDL